MTKLKRLRPVLAKWSRKMFGDIFKRPREAELAALEAEEAYDVCSTLENLTVVNKTQTQLRRAILIEEEYWQAKANVKWHKEGDRNTRFFQAFVKERRHKSSIQSIKNAEGQTLNDKNDIFKEGVAHFQKLLAEVGSVHHFDNMDCIPSMISSEDKESLKAWPSIEEVRDAVHDLNPESAAGVDGFPSSFFKSCWDIVKEDISQSVTAFFVGASLPRSVSSTLLVLIPKVEHPQNFADFRPISLCTFCNKIISKVLANRLHKVLPRVISMEQSGFVPERSIVENILLAHEFCHNFNTTNKTGNIILKLDMEKAYDRISWFFISTVLRKMGFLEEWIDCVWRLISNCWFNILINCQIRGFFKSGRGLRQRDPLSIGLFIIAAEALSRSLKNLTKERNFIPYRMPKACQTITHLSFADDIILFCSGDPQSLKMMFQRLQSYEMDSGQLVSKTKSNYICSDKVQVDVADELRLFSGFRAGSFPLTYLGCPLYSGRVKREYFNPILDKISKRILNWSSHLLSAGGRMTLIKSVLQSIPIYILAALMPPSSVLRDIEKILCNFLWGERDGGRNYHWFSWDNLCKPLHEGGLGFRRMADLCMSFSCKLWWSFRTRKSLWSSFLMQKYCVDHHPCVVSIKKEASTTWKRLLKARDLVEPDMIWLVGRGDIDLYHDNWLGMNLSSCAKHFQVKVSDLVMNGEVHPLMCHYFLPPNIVSSALKLSLDEEMDKAAWTLTPSGQFSIKSAWNLIRAHSDVSICCKQIWNSRIPLKVSFFSWRLLHNRVPTDDVIKRKFCVSMASICHCCKVPQEDSIAHIFFEGELARMCWSFFGRTFGVSCTTYTFEGMLDSWRNASADNVHLKLVLGCIPICIVWEIWKARNRKLFDDQNSSFVHVCNLVKNQIMFLSHKWFHGLTWDGFLHTLQGNLSHGSSISIQWQLPPLNFMKINTDGCVINKKGGGGGFCCDPQGNFKFAFTHFFGEVPVLEAEARAMEAGLDICKRYGLYQAVLETDSMVLASILNDDFDVP